MNGGGVKIDILGSLVQFASDLFGLAISFVAWLVPFAIEGSPLFLAFVGLWFTSGLIVVVRERAGAPPRPPDQHPRPLSGRPSQWSVAPRARRRPATIVRRANGVDSFMRALSSPRPPGHPQCA